MTEEMPQDPPAITTLATLEDDDYNSEEDSDFDPEAAARAAAAEDEDAESSSEGSDAEESAGTKKRRKGAKKGKGKKKVKKAEDVEYEEGGEGGLIKTRRQRELEALEEKTYKVTEVKKDASIDDIWASLQASAEPWKKPPTSSTPTQTASASPPTEPTPPTTDKPLSFAGEIISTPTSTASTPPTSTKPPTKGPRKRRTSAFDTGPVPVRAKKLNTIEKSKMDWDNFVAKEGIKEELVQHEKGGKGYVERQAFLGRTEEAAWEKRKGGSGAA